MTKEFCTECGTEITGITGFCPNCGAATNASVNKIVKDHKERQDQIDFDNKLKNLRKWYYKKDKNIKLAIFMNLLMPFLGTFYLKEEDKFYNYSIISIICSILILSMPLLAFLNVPSFIGMIVFLAIFIYIILWFVSTIHFIVLYLNHDKYNEEFDKYSKFLEVTYNHSDFIEKSYFKFLPLLGILGFFFVVAFVGAIFGF